MDVRFNAFRPIDGFDFRSDYKPAFQSCSISLRLSFLPRSAFLKAAKQDQYLAWSPGNARTSKLFLLHSVLSNVKADIYKFVGLFG